MRRMYDRSALWRAMTVAAEWRSHFQSMGAAITSHDGLLTTHRAVAFTGQQCACACRRCPDSLSRET